jgi:hypothetical protein
MADNPTIQITRDHHKTLKLRAMAEHTSIQALVNAALGEYLVRRADDPTARKIKPMLDVI